MSFARLLTTIQILFKPIAPSILPLVLWRDPSQVVVQRFFDITSNSTMAQLLNGTNCNRTGVFRMCIASTMEPNQCSNQNSYQGYNERTDQGTNECSHQGSHTRSNFQKLRIVGMEFVLSANTLRSPWTPNTLRSPWMLARFLQE
jgi:hypothetical protein